MFKSKSGIAASDVIRSMKRMGFADDEIYDVLTGIGLGGEQVQILIDRVSAEFHEAKLEPRPSRLATEVREVFEEAFEEMRADLFARADALSRDLQFLRTEVEKLGRRIVELQTLASGLRPSPRGRSPKPR